MAAAKFVRLKITHTYYGVGKTVAEARFNAINEYADDQRKLIPLKSLGLYGEKFRTSDDTEAIVEVVKIKDTPISKDYVDFVMSNEYGKFCFEDLTIEQQDLLNKKGGQ